MRHDSTSPLMAEQDTTSNVQHSDNSQSQTDKTDETDCAVTNEEFLTALFGSENIDVRPVLVSFSGNPAEVSKSAWTGFSRNPLGVKIIENHNNYFSLAVFRPNERGEYRRKKAQFAALHAVMLDDVGTKVPAERITLPASWWIETSPGNYQVGYILVNPETESAVADRLVNAIIAAGLCDPGANGPTARIARLPVGVNGKHEPHFLCRMTEWQPDRRYTIEELVNGLELEIQEAVNAKKKASREKAKTERKTDDQTCHDDDPIVIPRPTENTVIAALRLRGLYKTPLGSGKHDIICPWVSEHTGGIDGGTAYFEPTDHWPIGGFKCFHGHCADRHMSDLLQFLDIETKQARMKPTIRVVAGEIHRVVDAAEQELARAGKYYQRGGLIVTIITDPATKETRIQASNQPCLVHALSGAATWEKYDGRVKDYVRIDPPARHVTVLYDAAAYTHLPLLNGLARQPYFRSDGTLVTVPGYDSATSMFGIFAEREFSVPQNPTKEQAQAALRMLKDELSEFCFATETDRAAALCAMLTAAVRPRLPFAPMIHVKAHQPGSGKSYLCMVITVFATPQKVRRLRSLKMMRSAASCLWPNCCAPLR